MGAGSRVVTSLIGLTGIVAAAAGASQQPTALGDAHQAFSASSDAAVSRGPAIVRSGDSRPATARSRRPFGGLQPDAPSGADAEESTDIAHQAAQPGVAFAVESNGDVVRGFPRQGVYDGGRTLGPAYGSRQSVGSGGPSMGTRSGSVATKNVKCPIPMWNIGDFVCEESLDQPVDNVWKDSNGVQRKDMEEGTICTVRCPKERSWSEEPDVLAMECFSGAWTDASGSPLEGIACKTSKRSWLFLLVFLAAAGGLVFYAHKKKMIKFGGAAPLPDGAAAPPAGNAPPAPDSQNQH